MSEKTEWFQHQIKPVKVGLYECRTSPHLWYWNGYKWRNRDDSWDCNFQHRDWRGLVSDLSLEKDHE